MDEQELIIDEQGTPTPSLEQMENIDNNIIAGLQFIMNETAKYNDIIKNAKTEIKKKIFRKKVKKLQKELQMLLYLQHMREKHNSAPTEEIVDAEFEEVKSESV